MLKWVLIIILVVASGVKIPDLDRYALPPVDLKRVNIVTIYSGFSPEEVEADVTTPIEESLETVSGIDKYTSKSRENLSFISIDLDSEANDLEQVKTDIRNAIDKVSLPAEAETPDFREIKIDRLPILELGFISENLSLLELLEEVKNIQKQFQRIPGVSVVESLGLPDKEMHVLLNRQEMFEKKISVLEVINAIKTSKKRLFAGDLSEGNKVLNIITKSDFDTPQQVGNIIVRASGVANQGVIIRLKDIADVKWAIQDRSSLYRFKGMDGIGLQIEKKANADVIETVDRVKDFLEKKIPELNASGIEVVFHKDSSLSTRTKLSIVYQNLLAGLFLILLVLILFLNPKIAAFTALAVPFSVVLALGVASLLEVSINNVSLCGIIVALGILVDNAIVVGESIFYQRQQKISPIESSRKGLRLVAKPVTFAVLTTVIGFMALLLVEGNIGEFSYEIPIVVFLMLMISLMDSVFFLPSHLSMVSLAQRKPLAHNFLNRLSKLYEKSLTFILKKFYLSLSLSIVFLILGGAIGAYFSKFILFPNDQATDMSFKGEFAGGEGLDFTLGKVIKIEEFLNQIPEGTIDSYRTKVGGDFNNVWSIDITLSPFFEREMKAIDVKDFLFKKIEASKDELQLTLLDYFIDGGGPPSGKPIEIVVISNNEEKRKNIIGGIKEDFEKLGLFEIDSNLRETRNEWVIEPNAEAYYASLSPETIATTFRAAYEGLLVEKVTEKNKSLDIRVKFDPKYVNFQKPLDGITARNNFGEYVPLKDVVDFYPTQSSVMINHRDGVRQNTIDARFDESKTSVLQIYKQMQKKYSSISEKDSEVSILIGGEAEEASSTFNSLIFSLMISIMAIYALLTFQFNRISQPLMVISSIPFGTVGLLIIFALHGKPVSAVAMIGVIGFGGVVINASIIMVDFINRMIQEKSKEYQLKMGGEVVHHDGIRGIPKDDYEKLIVKGAVARLRPIFITTLTTLGGIGPTAYGLIGNTDSFIGPIALAMMWGLTFGTISCLFVIPMFYYLIERWKKLFLKFVGRSQTY